VWESGYIGILGVVFIKYEAGAELASSSKSILAYIRAGSADEAPRALSSLARHANPAIRRRLAENPNTAQEILQLLAGDESAEVRAGLAWNPSVSEAVLERLCADEDVNVRLALTDNHCLPRAILMRLSADENPYVQHHAWRALEVAELESLLRVESFTVQHGLNAKLGDLMVAAGLVSAVAMRDYLDTARVRRLPLGHVLIRDGNMSKVGVAKALKLQSAVRHSQLTVDAAVAQLKGRS